ncbi:tetratricopeptide repeat protein [Ornithinimicrobium sp. W1679]|uniref:tetratricopeptide repeat protein n=1 Tax=Ornithinimicrobium sp. W1679 TaxID=3418770 RepID=UPI003CECEC52
MDDMERMLRGLGAGGGDGEDRDEDGPGVVDPAAPADPGTVVDPAAPAEPGDLGEPGPALPPIQLPGDDELDDHARYDRATFLFQSRSYSRAVELLVPLVDAEPGNAEIRLLLARAHYHSASLGRAEEVLRGLLERWPTDAYAHLLLARTLQRAGRAEEGAPHLKIAEAMGLQA